MAPYPPPPAWHPPQEKKEKSTRIGSQAKFQSILREWNKFIRGDTQVDKAVVPQAILDSWRRCREQGLDPFKLPKQKILTAREIGLLRKENRQLMQMSKFFLTHYHSLVSLTPFSVSFFDPQGRLIEMRIAEKLQAEAHQRNWLIGALWNEESMGTSSIGLVIKTKEPSRVFGPEHYFKHIHESTAYAAPIFDPAGNFLGGVVLLCRYYESNKHAHGMTIAAAHLIENQLKINQALAEAQAAFVKSEIAGSYQQTVIASIPEALLAVDHKGFITLINDQARKIFGIGHETMVGQHVRKAFGHENRHLLTLLEGQQALLDVEVRIDTQKMGSDYTLTCNPILSSQGESIGKILIFTEIRRVKKLVTHMIGAKANFSFDDFCGKNIGFLNTVEQARMASQSRSNVLLLGESGAGKDIYAQAIHNASDRKNGPYIAINCGAVPRELIASELFGHEEGAFTGSRRGGNQGKFELADGGTIFLDEIGETPLEMQTVLLRVIEDKCVIRIGGAKVRPVDVRIIAATNKDLLAEVYKGNFRRDLYYRLNVFTLHLLPLSERTDDIPLFVDYFVNKFSTVLGKRIVHIDQKIIDLFMNYPWPGNIRELQNVVERMMNCVQTAELTADLVPHEIAHHETDLKSSLEIQSPKDFEKQMIMRLMRLNIPKTEIARRLNIDRSTLYRKLEQYHLTSMA